MSEESELTNHDNRHEEVEACGKMDETGGNDDSVSVSAPVSASAPVPVLVPTPGLVPAYGAKCTKLGSGADGDVFSVKMMDGNRYAVKHLRRRKPYTDYTALKLVGSHPNIVPLLHTYRQNGSQYLVFPLCTPLAHRHPLLEEDAQTVARDVLAALTHIHGLGMRYGDLKPENIMFLHDKYVLVDFGFCEKVQPDKPAHSDSGGLGTLDFMAPELTYSESPHYSLANDVWSLGVLVFFLLTHELPFGHRRSKRATANIRAHILSLEALNAWRWLSPAAKEFLEAAWCHDVLRRPTVTQLADFAFFAQT